MMPAWLRKLSKKLVPTSPPPIVNLRSRKLVDLIELEDRVTPATITWINPLGGDWLTATNWSGGVVPGAADDVVIPDLGVTGPSLTVNFMPDGNFPPKIARFRSLTTSENVLVQDSSTGAMNLTLVDGDLAINNNASFDVRGIQTTTPNAFLIFESNNAAATQRITTSGGGKLKLFAQAGIVQGGTSHTVVFSSGLEMSGHGAIGTKNAGVGGKWINQGTIVGINSSAATLSIQGDQFTNEGVIVSDLEQTLIGIGSSQFINMPGSQLSVSQGLISLGSSTSVWTNSGNINVSGGTLNLGGSFTTADVANFTRTGGTVNLTGTLTGNLPLNAAVGSWNLAGGTIQNGTISTLDGTSLSIATGAFDSVTLAGLATLSAGVLTIRGDLGLTGSLTVQNDSEVYFSAATGVTQNVTGTGSITLTGTTGTNRFQQSTASHTVAFRSGLSINANSRPAIVGDTFHLNSTPPFAGNWENEATWTTTSSTLTFQTSNFINRSGGVWQTTGGVLEIAGSAIDSGNLQSVVNLGGNFSNEGTMRLQSGSLTTGGTWSNTGLLEISSGRLFLGGSTTTAGLGTWNRTGGEIFLNGFIDNAGKELVLDSVAGGRGTLNLAFKSVIQGGTITTRNGALLVAKSFNTSNPTTDLPVLRGVTISTGSEFAVNRAWVSIQNGLTLDGLITTNNGPASAEPTLFITGTQTWLGSGELRYQYVGGNATFIESNTTWTIGQNLTVRGATGTFGTNTTGTAIVNHGTFLAESNGRFLIGNGVGSFTNSPTGKLIVASSAADLQIESGSFTNQGLITIPTGQFSLNSAAWTNLGTINLTNGTLLFGGNFTQPDIGTFNRTGGIVRLTGVLSGGLQLNDALGHWSFTGGTLKNGTFSVAPGSTATLYATPTTSFLDNVTLASPLDLESSSTNNIQVTNSLTLQNITQPIGNAAGTTSARVRFSNFTQNLGGTGTFVFGGSTSNTIDFLGNATILPRPIVTIEPGITIRGKSGLVGAANGTGLMNNFGKIQADVAGGTIRYRFAEGSYNAGTMVGINGSSLTVEGFSLGTQWSNSGTIDVNGGTLTIGDQNTGSGNAPDVWTNTGTIIGTNATVNLGGGLSQQRLGNFVRTGGTVSLLRTWQGDLTLSDTTGSWEFKGVVSNGKLTTSGSAALIARSSPTFNDYTINGNLDLTRYSQTIFTGGTFTLNSVLPVGDAAGSFGLTFDVRNSPLWTGTGGLVWSNTTAHGFSGNNVPFTVDAGLTLQVQSLRVQSISQFINKGIIIAGGNGKTLEFGGRVNNQGTFQAINGGTILMTGVVDNLTSNVLNSGKWFIGASSTLRLPSAINTINADLTLDGGNSNIFVGASPSTTNALAGLTAIQADGSLTLSGGRNLTPPGNFTTTGRLIVGGGSAFTLPTGQPLTITNGLAELRGGTISSNTPIQLQSGTLQGVGTVNATVVNTAGTVAPGNSPGILNITGDYTQGPNGTLDLEIGGRDPDVPEFDRLRVTGTATLDGTIRLTNINSFESAPGDSFRVLSAANRVGTFRQQDFPTPGGAGRQYKTAYDATGLTILTTKVPPLEFLGVTTASTMTPMDTAIDANGNTYVVGEFTGTVDFDPTTVLIGDTLTTLMPSGFVAKYLSTGKLSWVRSIAATSEARALGVAINLQATGIADDLVYVVGSFTGSLSYAGGAAVHNNLTESGYLLQVDSNGIYGTSLAQSTSGGVGIPSGQLNQVAVQPTGNIVVIGDFSRGIDLDLGLGGTIFFAEGKRDAVIAEYDPTLSLVRYGRIAGSAGTTTVHGIALATTANGDIWIAGEFDGPTTMTPVSGPAGLAAFATAGLSDAYLLKLTPSGGGFTTTVAQTFGSSGNDTGNSVVVDAAGNAFLAGGFQFSVDFDVLPSRSFALSSGGDQDGYVLKLDASGGFQWARGFGGFRSDVVNDLAVDGNGNVYSTGTFTDRVDFDPQDGSYILQTNPTTNNQAFLLKLNGQGEFVWATALGEQPTAISSGQALATDGERIVSVGTFNNTVDFDPSDNQVLRTGPGGYLSLLKQKASPVVTIRGLPTGAAKEGDVISAVAQVVDPDSVRFLYSWTVESSGNSIATGTGSAITFAAVDQGFYTVSVTVTDEAGNTGTASNTIAVTNTAPILNPTTFAAATSVFMSGAIDESGTALASGFGRILVGSPSGSTNLGSVTVVNPAGGSSTISNPNAAVGRFGQSLAVVGNRLAVAATGRATDLNGVVHLYTEAAGVFTLERSLSLTDAVLADGYGTSLTSIGNLLVVGAPGRTVNGVSGGAVYLYDATSGVLVRTIVNPTAVADDRFGAALASANGLLIISAPGDDTAGLNAGSVYVYDPGSGQLLRTITNPNAGFLNGEFGTRLAASNTVLAVGAANDDSGGTDAGSVYLYSLSAGAFGSSLGVLRNPGTGAVAGSRFGTSLAINGDRLAVGAINDNTTTANTGTVYVFDIDPLSSTFRTNRHLFKKLSPATNDRFGTAVVPFGDDWYASAVTTTGLGSIWRFAATSFVTQSATTINENGTVTISGSFFDAGRGDAHTLLIDWGMPGNPPTRVSLAAGVNTFSVTNRYLDDNPTGTSVDVANVRVRVLDTVPDILQYDGGLNNYDRLVAIDGVTLVPKRELIPLVGSFQVLATAVTSDGDIVALRSPSFGVNQIDRYHGGTGDFLGTIVPSAVLAPLLTGLNLTGDPMIIGPNQNIYLATDDRVVQFDSRTGTIVFNAPVGGIAWGLAFGPDGMLYAILAASQQVIRIDPATGANLGIYLNTNELPSSAVDLAFGDNGVVYVAGSSLGGSQLIRRYDFATREVLGDLVSNRPSTSSDSYVLIDGDTLIGGSGNDGYVTRYDLSTGTVISEVAANNAQFGGLLNPMDETTASVTVTNVAPTVRITAARNDVGTYTLKALPADVGTLDPLSVSWKINGVSVAATADGTVTFNAANTSATTVLVTVNDDDLGVVTSTFTVIVGTGAADAITLGNTSANVNGTILNYAAGTSRVVVYGLGGDDIINASGNTATPVELVGGYGNDTLIGGNFNDVLRGNNPEDYNPNAQYTTEDLGNDSLSAGAGDDTLDGGLGNDTMVGGTGNDTYIQVSGSTDLLSETTGSGIDTIDLVYSYRGVNLSLAYDAGEVQTVDSQNHEVILSGVFENLYGSGFNDTLSGNAVSNDLRGGLGNDLLFGSDPSVFTVLGISDDDSIRGGGGNDTIDGGSGNDIIFGTDGLTVLAAGITDDDSIRGGTGNDTIDGGSGNDIIFGTDGLTVLAAGITDDDSIRGGTGNDTIDGGSGNDIIFGTDGLAILAVGITDDDSIRGGGGNDTIDGGSGNDIIFGSDGLAILAVGITDDDSIRGGGGNDTIDGGSGNDIIFGTDGLTVLAAGITDDDSIRGGTGNDTIDGGSGNDIIFGSDGLAILAVGITDDDSIRGGGGNDTIDGGSGNDIIFGSDGLTVLAVGITDDDSIRGGGGNDTIDGGSGNDIIFGTDGLAILAVGITDDDSIRGGTGNDTIDGGSGNDIIFGTDGLTVLAAGITDDDSIRGGTGNDTIDGGSGNDIIFGSDGLAILAVGITDDDSIRGGTGNDTIDGGSGNDIIFGNQDDDQLTGGLGLDIIEGGSGNDRIVEQVAGIVTLNSAELLISGQPSERLYDIEEAQLFGSTGDDLINASAFFGPVLLFGDAGNDTLIGGVFGDQLFGSSGIDSLVGGEGDDQLSPGSGNDTSDGQAGNDVYFIVPNGIDTLIDSQGIDTLDLSGANFGVTIDLNLFGAQTVDVANNVLVFNGTIENIRGTSFADTLTGSSDRNILEGGGGIDLVSGNAGADTLFGDFTQLVYLDFNSATGPNEYRYSIEERNLIQARLEADFAFPFNIVFTQTRPSIGRYGTIILNAGDAGSNEALIAGLASELDFRNVNTGSVALINVNGFLGRRGQPAATSANYVALTSTLIAHELGHLLGLRHHDSFGPIGEAALGESYGIFVGLPDRSKVLNERITGNGSHVASYAFGVAKPVIVNDANFRPNGSIFSGSTLVATFVVEANGSVTLTPTGPNSNLILAASFTAESTTTGGGILTITWAFPPQSSSIIASYRYEAFRPGYAGPTNANETRQHIMASPVSVGTSLLDALGNPYFGERELIRLAFTNAGVTRNEAALPTAIAPPVLGGSARVIGELPALAVPNLLPNGTRNAGLMLNVRAISVIGSIQRTLGGTGPSENDVYAIQANAGEYLTIEVLSVSLRQRLQAIDSIIRVYDSNGQLVNYYGRPAINDDGFDNQDPIVLDLPIRTPGTYYIVVDTFAGSSDTQVGGYELYVYSYTNPTAGSPRQGGSGDTVVGGAGNDILSGSAGDDDYRGTLTEDILLGTTSNDFVRETNTAPTITVEFNTTSPRTNDLLTATVTPTDVDNDVVYLTYVWRVNGIVVRTTVSSTATTDTLDLNILGNGNRGDVITVAVASSDRIEIGGTASASAMVANSAPTVSVSLNTTTPAANSVLTATAVGEDVDNNPMLYTYRWFVNGVVEQVTTTATTTDNFDLSVLGRGNPGNTIRVEVDAADDQAPSHVASATATVENSQPSVSVTLNTNTPRTHDVLIATAVGSDSDHQSLLYTFRWYVNEVLIRTSAATAATVDTFDLSVVGQGDRGDTIRVDVEVFDGIEASEVASATATVINTAPTATVTLNTSSPRTSDVLIATVSGNDDDGDVLTYTYRWYVNNILVPAATTNTFDLGVQGNRGDTVRVDVEANDGTASSSTASATATVINTAPTVSVTLNTSSPRTSDVLIATVSGNDDDSDTLSYTYRWYVNNSLVPAATSNTFDLGVMGNRGDTVRVDVEANDGTASSSTASATATVINTAPTVSVTLNTSSPRTSDVLIATVVGNDDDGDTLSYTYRWYVNNILVPAATTNTFDLSVQGNRGDTVRVEVEANDGTASSSTASATATVANTAPTATVTLNTSSPRTSDVLVATVSGNDADGDTLSYTYRWYVNNILVPAATSNTFDLGVQGNRGDTIRVDVVVFDGIEASEVVSATATVINTAPTVSVTLNTSSPRTSDVLIATVVGNDDDSDVLTYTYRWYVNNSLVPAATSNTFDLGVMGNRGDTVRVDVEANDGTVVGTVASATATVINTPPVANANSYTTNQNTPLTITAPGLLGNDSDLDADSLTVTSYTQPSSGSVIVNANGSFTYTPTATFSGTTAFTYTVSDGFGGSATATVNLTVLATSSTLTVAITGIPSNAIEGSAITLGSSVTGGMGPFTYAWTASLGTTVVATANTASFQFTPPDNGTYTIQLTASNATSSGTVTRTFTVGNIAPMASITRSGLTTATAVNVTVGLVNVVDPSVADTTAGFRYSFATSVSGLATSYTLAGTAAQTTFSFPQSLSTRTIYLRVFDQDNGYTDTDVQVWIGTHGNDHFDGGSGIDLMFGLGGNDTLIGGSGNDWLDGGSGNDFIRAISGDDDLIGGSGNDELQAGSGADRLDGGEGNDELYGKSGNDTLFGGNGNDELYGGGQGDLLYGEAGHDVLVGGGGADQLFGGIGNDELYGGGGGDILRGGDGNDWLKGGGGSDRVYGEAGNDTLLGGGRNDLLDGGADDDTFWGWGGIYVDNTLVGGSGNDRIYNGDCDGDELELDTWLPTIDIEVIQGGGGDRIRGNSGDNVLNFRNTRLIGIDEVDGKSGNDTITTSQFAAGLLYLGGSGDDTLIGSTATDRLEGGGGNDVFRFVARNISGEDRIDDFRKGRDKIDLSALGVSWSAIQQVRSGNDWLIRVTLPPSLGGGILTIRLKNFNGTLDTNDFIL